LSDLDAFLKDGNRFKCQCTGACCTSRGGYGYVYLSENEALDLSKLLNLTKEIFLDKFCELTDDGIYYLKNPENDCFFLEDKKCTVYRARPSQCRTWPFWPENMNDESWKKDVESFCAGVGKGEKVTPDKIKELLKQDLFYGEEIVYED